MMITPNHLTFLRGILAGVIGALLIFSARPIVSAITLGLFVIAIVTDWLDGLLARRMGCVSSFGKIADPIADKLLVLGVLFALAYRGLFSVWWVVPIAIREAVVTLVRIHQIRSGTVLAADTAGKIKTTFQCGTIVVAFLSLLIQTKPASDFLTPVLYGGLVISNVLTLVSGYLFFDKLFRRTPRKWQEIAATFLFVGHVKPFPGTLASAIALIFLLDRSSPGLQVVLILVTLVAGRYAAQFMMRKTRRADPQEVVIDEVLGILLTFLFIPISMKSLVAGFLLFRLLDIWKPFPIRLIERAPNGWGIMLDDAAAAVYANLVLQAAYRHGLM